MAARSFNCTNFPSVLEMVIGITIKPSFKAAQKR